MIVKRKTSKELQAEGRRRADRGELVVIVHPSQVWMFVDQQLPFVLCQPIPIVLKEKELDR